MIENIEKIRTASITGDKLADILDKLEQAMEVSGSESSQIRLEYDRGTDGLVPFIILGLRKVTHEREDAA